MEFLKLCQRGTYISTLRAVVISPRSVTLRQPNQSLRILTTVALASRSFPLTNISVVSVSLAGSTMTLAFTVFKVFTTLDSGKARWIRSPSESVLHTVNVHISEERSSGLDRKSVV